MDMRNGRARFSVPMGTESALDNMEEDALGRKNGSV